MHGNRSTGDKGGERRVVVVIRGSNYKLKEAPPNTIVEIRVVEDDGQGEVVDVIEMTNMGRRRGLYED